MSLMGRQCLRSQRLCSSAGRGQTRSASSRREYGRRWPPKQDLSSSQVPTRSTVCFRILWAARFLLFLWRTVFFQMNNAIMDVISSYHRMMHAEQLNTVLDGLHMTEMIRITLRDRLLLAHLVRKSLFVHFRRQSKLETLLRLASSPQCVTLSGVDSSRSLVT